MAKISTTKCATIELSEEDWSKLNEVYTMLGDIQAELDGIDVDFDSPEVTYEGFGKDYAVGEHLENVYNALDELFCCKSGLY